MASLPGKEGSKEVINSPLAVGGELVTYFLPPHAPEQGQAPDGGGEASGVVSREAEPQGNAFAHDAEGGFGVASGEPKPNPTEPLAVLEHQGGTVRRAWFKADEPPSGEPLDAYIDGDDFLRRLARA